jgi:hypothetical protein
MYDVVTALASAVYDGSMFGTYERTVSAVTNYAANEVKYATTRGEHYQSAIVNNTNVNQVDSEYETKKTVAKFELLNVGLEWYGVAATGGIASLESTAINTFVKTTANIGQRMLFKNLVEKIPEQIAKEGGENGSKMGLSVLGKYPDYLNLASELGAKRFNIPTHIWEKMTSAEQWAANQKFLDRMISRGDKIILSNPVLDINNVTGAYRKELDYLIKNGYKFDSTGTQMTK